MTEFYRQCTTKTTEKEREFCRALLNNEDPIWDENDFTKKCKRGFRLPPDDFVYGLKHPKQNGITGVAAALQYYEAPIYKSKSITIPNFITINKTAVRLGLTKVQDIHKYRKSMNNHQIISNSCYRDRKESIPDIIHGRITGEQQSIRDVLEHKYLHEWLRKAAIRRCKEILNKI